MAYDKIVDSAKLDADLTMVADAIRARAGTTEPLAFPEGMKEAVEGITNDTQQIIDSFLTKSITHIYSEITSPIVNYMCTSLVNLVSADFPNLTATYAGAFERCEKLTDVNIPNVKKFGNDAFSRCTALRKVDLPKVTAIGSSVFWLCSSLTTVILRANQVATLENTNAFDRSPFASGGTGGTVYVPSALIAQYQTATNWSTLYAAGTCNFVAIEGSEYE